MNLNSDRVIINTVMDCQDYKLTKLTLNSNCGLSTKMENIEYDSTLDPGRYSFAHVEGDTEKNIYFNIIFSTQNKLCPEVQQ